MVKIEAPDQLRLFHITTKSWLDIDFSSVFILTGDLEDLVSPNKRPGNRSQIINSGSSSQATNDNLRKFLIATTAVSTFFR